ncbi:MAG: hypothetical protein ABIR66_03430 [Saprospiraceae bacterium]
MSRININNYIGLVVFCSYTMISAAQSFHIHLDKTYYIVGESIHYQIYPESSLINDSMLIYVELYSGEGKMESQHIHRLLSKSVGGKIDLPVSMKENYYEFICYSIWNKQDGDSTRVSSQRTIIPIYNDLDIKPEASELLSDTTKGDTIRAPAAAKIKVRSDAEVKLDIKDQVQNIAGGEYSVVITDPSSASAFEGNLVTNHRDPEKITAGFNIRKELMLEGTVTDPFTHKLIDEKYLSLYIPSIKYFKRISAVQGKIKTTLPDLAEYRDLQILSMNPNTRYPLILDLIKTNVTFSINPGSSKLVRTPAMLSILNKHGKQRLINDLFEEHIQDTSVGPLAVPQFVPDKRFILAKFQELTTLEEFIKEVMLEARITTIIGNRKSLRLRSKEKNLLYKWPAWYMLDGIFQSSEEAMLNFDIAKIKSLELYQRDLSIESQFDPLMKYSGVFSITTYLHEEPKDLVYTLNGLSKNSSTSMNRIPPGQPDLRSTLTWQPKLVPDSQGMLKINFQSSDLKGKYLIDVQGVNGSGDFVRAQYAITFD